MPPTSSFSPTLRPPSRWMLLVLVGALVALCVGLYVIARPLLHSLPAERIPGARGITATWLPDAANPGGLTLEQVVALDESGAFEPLPDPATVPVLNARRIDARWFCIQINNTKDRPALSVLDLVWQNYDRATLYQLQDGVWTAKSAGETVPPGEAQRSSRLMAFGLAVPEHTSVRAYLRVADYTRLPAQFQIWRDPAPFLAWERLELAKHIGLLCLLVAMLAYGVFSYAMLHQRDQLYYSGMVLLKIIYQLLNPHVAGLLVGIPGSPWREMILGSLSGLLVIGYCLFTRHFFDLKNTDPKADRSVTRAQWAILGGVFLLPLPLWPATAFFNLMTVTTLMMSALAVVLWAGIRRWRAGVPQAPLFVLAFAVIIGGRLQFLFKGPDIVVRYDAEIFVSMLCTGFSLLVLALAAAYRHRLVQDEHLALRTDYTSRLETEVAERTRVLQELSERLAATVAERDRILAIVGHDLRGPAGSLQSLSRILAHDALTFTPEELGELSREIEDACAVQLDLLNNLLVWGGTQSGHSRHASAQPVGDALMIAWKPLAAQAAQKQITLLDALPAGLQVQADPALLQTILRNLLANAVKYTAPGGRIEVGGDPLASGQVEVWVRDNGTGIAPARLELLFQGPVQSAPGTSDERGAGLGLSLCRDLARAAGGDLRLESELGRGTTARVTLPAA